MRFEECGDELHVILDRESSRILAGPKRHKHSPVQEATISKFRRGLLYEMKNRGFDEGRIRAHSIHRELVTDGIVESLHSQDLDESLVDLNIFEIEQIATGDDGVRKNCVAKLSRAMKRLRTQPQPGG